VSTIRGQPENLHRVCGRQVFSALAADSLHPGWLQAWRLQYGAVTQDITANMPIPGCFGSSDLGLGHLGILHLWTLQKSVSGTRGLTQSLILHE
jgi:hypothetical protein